MADKFTLIDFKNAKKEKRKISMLTAYDYSTARIIDEAGIDVILVGDSLGMVVLGYEDTTCVTMEDMLHHVKAVTRAAKRAFVVGDMPFLSYNTGKNEAVKNAGRFISEGRSNAVKLEGGHNVTENIKAIVSAGIPVMGHLGYTPQSINIFGGHKAQGCDYESAKKIIDDATALEQAGVFAIVLECVPYKLARFITEKISVPVIGIGAGPFCDGQVLVVNDMLGLSDDFKPRHNKVYAECEKIIKQAVKEYDKEVRKGEFPETENSFNLKEEAVQKLFKTNKIY